jgi:hypothetical protein
MNTLINLDKWVTPEGTNCIEVYLSKHIGVNPDSHIINISTDPETKTLLSKFGKGTFTKLKNYYHKDYQYSYDLSTDAQKVTKRFHLEDWNPHARIYVVSYNENVLTSHMFPTTSDITHVNIIERTTYRINNRLFIYNDKVYGETESSNLNDLDDFNEMIYNEYIYLRYNHSQQVDLKQIQLDIERVVRQLITPPSKSNPYL